MIQNRRDTAFHANATTLKIREEKALKSFAFADPNVEEERAISLFRYFAIATNSMIRRSDQQYTDTIDITRIQGNTTLYITYI